MKTSIRWLHKRIRLTGTRYERERGAVAIVAAITLAMLLVAVGSLAVDTGFLFTERRQAQNAADAAALSVAQSCASSTECTDLSGNPTQWAQDNSKASMAHMSVTNVCGTAGSLIPCPAGDTSKLPDCPDIPTPANYVEVHTETDNSAHLFSLHGGEHTQACSRVAWGSPGSITTTIPFIIGTCEFEQSTNATGDPATGGVFPPDPASHPVAIALNYAKGSGCEGWNGHDFPGGFGWLTSDSCQVTVPADGWVPGTPGESGHSGADCSSQISASVGHIVYLPVFDNIDGKSYHVAGLAAFRLDGIDYPSYKGNRGSTDGLACPDKSGKKCLYGQFVKALTPVGSIDPSAPDLGLTVIQMTG